MPPDARKSSLIPDLPDILKHLALPSQHPCPSKTGGVASVTESGRTVLIGCGHDPGYLPFAQRPAAGRGQAVQTCGAGDWRCHGGVGGFLAERSVHQAIVGCLCVAPGDFGARAGGVGLYSGLCRAVRAAAGVADPAAVDASDTGLHRDDLECDLFSGAGGFAPGQCRSDWLCGAVVADHAVGCGAA